MDGDMDAVSEDLSRVYVETLRRGSPTGGNEPNNVTKHSLFHDSYSTTFRLIT